MARRKCPRCGKTKLAKFYYKGNHAGISTYCSQCSKEKSAEWRSVEENKEKRWVNHIKTNYNLTAEAWFALKAKQGDCCGICGEEFVRRPVVDHCHDTGEVRGLLCSQCNRSLGALGDNLVGINRAVRYLTRARRVRGKDAQL